eukprot:scaffold127821_cov35-Tisochrysis_lutea.AAC.3
MVVQVLEVELPNENGRYVAHDVVQHSKEALVAQRKPNAAHRRVVLPRVEALARANLPELAGVICRASEQFGRVPVDIERPDGAAVAMIRSNPLSILRVPKRGHMVLGS